MTVLDGERVAAKVKQFMAMIQCLTTDYMLKQFVKAEAPITYKKKPAPPQEQTRSKKKRKQQGAAQGQDMPPETEATEADREAARKKFAAIQEQREPHLRVKVSDENITKFMQANEWYKKRQQEIQDDQNRRNANLGHFDTFVKEW